MSRKVLKTAQQISTTMVQVSNDFLLQALRAMVEDESSKVLEDRDVKLTPADKSDLDKEVLKNLVDDYLQNC